jgi:hypothetical protein
MLKTLKALALVCVVCSALCVPVMAGDTNGPPAPPPDQSTMSSTSITTSIATTVLLFVVGR